MVKKLSAKLHVNSAGGMNHQVVANDAHHQFKHQQCSKSDGQNIQRSEASMHQHFVHNDLKEKGRG